MKSTRSIFCKRDYFIYRVVPGSQFKNLQFEAYQLTFSLTKSFPHPSSFKLECIEGFALDFRLPKM